MNEKTRSTAREVLSNQEGPFKDLEKLVRKYACTPYLRPIADHTRLAFADAEQFIGDFYAKRPAQSAPLPVILDSGCGTGESTFHLANQFPDIPVIGIDKSAVRLEKAALFADNGIHNSGLFPTTPSITPIPGPSRARQAGVSTCIPYSQRSCVSPIQQNFAPTGKSTPRNSPRRHVFYKRLWLVIASPLRGSQ